MSTNEDELLRLLSESTGNPLPANKQDPDEEDETDELLRAIGGPPESERDSDFTDQLLRAAAGEEGIGIPPTFPEGSSLEAFAKSAAEEALLPLNLIGLQPELDEVEGRPVASTVGSLVGLGVGFIPFIGAAQRATAGLKGAGLLKGMSQNTIRAMEGAASFGAFEFGAAETLEEAPQRGLIGAAAGAVLDPLIMKAFERFAGGAAIASRRASNEKALEALKRGEELVDLATIKTGPWNLSIERNLHPEKLLNTDATGYTVRQLVEPEKQLDEVLATVGHVYSPSGVTIIPAIQGPETLVPKIKRTLPNEVRVLTRKSDDGLFELALVDERTVKSRLVAKLESIEERTETQETLLRRLRGEENRIDPDEAVKAVRETTDLEYGPRSELNDFLVARGFGELSETTLGSHFYEPPRDLIVLRSGSNKEFETLIHEYGHKFQTYVAGLAKPNLASKVGSEGGRLPTSLYNVEDLFTVAGRDASSSSVESVKAQMRKLSEEILTEFHVRSGLSRKSAREVARESIKNRSEYFLADKELTSRALEVMAWDPKRARKLAPEAVDLLDDVIREVSPTLDRLLFNETRVVNEILTSGRRTTRRVFADVRTRVTPEMRKQFKETGFFDGMEVITPDGRVLEYVSTAPIRRAGKRPLQGHKLRDPSTGEEVLIRSGRLIRPELPRVRSRTARLVSAMDELLEEGVGNRVGVAFFDGETRSVLNGEINLTNYARTDDLASWVRQNRPGAQTGVQGRRPRGGPVTDEEAAEVARRLGYDGILVEDQGAFEVLVANRESVILGDALARESIEPAFDALLGQTRFPLSFDSVMKSALLRSGATQRELPFLMDIAKERRVASLLQLMDDEARAAWNNARGIQAGRLTQEQSLDELASTVGLEVERSSGQYRVLHGQNKSELAAGLSEEEARQYLIKSGVESDSKVFFQSSDDLAVQGTTGGTSTPQAASQVPDEGLGGLGTSGKPPRPQEQMASATGEELAEAGFTEDGILERIGDSVSLLLARATNMETFSKIAERRGMGPVFTKIFEPLQKARKAVDQEIGFLKRDFFGGETFKDRLTQLEDMMQGFSKEEKTKVVEYIEFMTKSEIAAEGGLLPRGMNQLEIATANKFIELGLGKDIPKLIATNRHINHLIETPRTFLEQVASTQRRDMSDELRATLERLAQQAREQTPKTREEAMTMLNLTREERQGLEMIEGILQQSPDDMSLMAIGRYAEAPELPAGFSSGREWFAKAHGLNEIQLAAASSIDEILERGFALSGMDAKRQIGGYWPHMRKVVQHDPTVLDPRRQSWVRREMPDAWEWSQQRIRSGELDIYSMDPTANTYRYLRGLFMKKHMDPVLPQAKGALEEVKMIDGRIHRIMSEYVDEIQGFPHPSFGKAQQAIESGFKSMGIDVDPDFVRKYTNFLTLLTYGATIPFRPALVARNAYEIFQKVPSRVGGRSFKEGLRRAMADGGMEEARAAGAIPENLAPLFAVTEVAEESVFGRVGFGKLNKLVQKGFDWYRGPDDFGRAIAYHAQRHRMEGPINRLMKESDYTWKQFLQDSKISTMERVDQQKIRQLIDDGQIEEAKKLAGATLSRETMVRYGHSNHPAGWGSIYGRLFGQFGTWPVQYKDFLLQGMRRGTTKDKMEFAAWQLGTNAGIIAAGDAVGLDLFSWAAFPSLNYTGGPFAGMTLDMLNAVRGSESERALAINNLKYTLPTLDNPQSVFIPLSYAASDLMRLREGPEHTLEAFGFKLERPGEKSAVEDILDGFD